MRTALALSLVVTLVSACGVPTGATARARGHPVKLPSGKVLQSEVMASDADRQMGLMFARPWRSIRGCCSCSSSRDLRVLDEELQVPDRHGLAGRRPQGRGGRREGAAVQEGPCPSYGGMQRSVYVVEMNAGQARREKVTLGAILDFKLPAR